MKWSNPALAVVAAFLISVSAYAEQLTTSIDIDIPADITVPSEQTRYTGIKIQFLPKHLTASQTDILTMAYDIAKEDGHKDPQLLQGIVLQESNAGLGLKYARTGQPFYGVAQIKVEAARDVLQHYPEIAEEFQLKDSSSKEIIKRLTNDVEFNLSVASKYLLILRKYGFDTIRQLALAYNQGPGGAKRKNPNTFYYPNGVVRHIYSLSK